ncbi:MAG TPA: response regulator transcription factor [Actinomycetota bacterium]|nr:response regulator transcription factor [Actinomycetota bacterium]
MKRVVLIDDDQMVRKLLSRAVRRWGLEPVGEAENGVAGLEVVAQTAPDVVIIDCSMPEMDGIETTRRLLAETPDLKVIAYTGDVANEEQMREAGAIEFIQKGESIDDVRAALERLDLTGPPS